VPTKPVEFHDQAGVEYDAAFDWYLERSPDAAFGFDAEVNRALAISLLLRVVGLRTAFHSPIFAAEISLHLIYRERAEGIQIVAGAHTSRKPG
jgi:plasmid stabilization system protein ParE